MSKPVSGVIVYILQHHKDETRVLFMRRSGGQFSGAWWPVAGTPKPLESPIETAFRELQEETGLTPASLYEFGCDIPNADGIATLKVFVGYVTPETPIVLDYEHDDYRWLTLIEAGQQVPSSSKTYIEYLDEMFARQIPTTREIRLPAR